MPNSKSGAPVPCKCDGTGDDWECLQKTIDASAAVSFTSQQICISKRALNLSSNKELQGNGAEIHFDLAADTTGFNIAGSYITISGLKIEYKPRGKRTDNAVIRFGEGAAHVAIRDNEIKGNAVYQGILSDLPRTKNVIISGNRIENAAYGILVNAHHLDKANHDVYQSHWIIQNNRLRNITADAIELNSPVGVIRPDGMSIHHFKVLNNDLEAGGGKTAGAGFCIGIAGLKHGEVSGNQMKNCKWQCIHVEDYSGHLLIKKNVCENTIGPQAGDKTRWSPQDSAGIILLATVHDVQVLENEVSNTAGYGILLTADPRGHTRQTVVSGNVIKNAGAHGIFVGGDTHHHLDALIGPSQGLPGNRTHNSAMPKGSPGPNKGSILHSGGGGVQIIGNEGN